MIEAPAADDLKAERFGFLNDPGQHSLLDPDEGLVIFPHRRQSGVLAREAAALRDLLDRHVAEAAERKTGRCADPLERLPELRVRPAEFQDPVAAVPFVETGIGPEISFRHEDGAAVLDDEGVDVGQGPAPAFGLESRLAGAEDQGDAGLDQGFERVPGRLETIGLVVKKGPVEVAEDYRVAHHDRLSEAAILARA